MKNMNAREINRIWKKVVQEESELPGDMPDEMWEYMQGNRKAATKVLRMVVKTTKENIIYRAAQEIRRAAND